MNPDRWQKIESIFQKALDAGSGGRASVLEDSCAGDGSLRREVESLLAQHKNAKEFIERPAFDASPNVLPPARARSGSADSEGIPAGTVFGHYRMVGKIGSGGMGVVYEAEDLKLRRHVALKFLPEDVAAHPQALQRFRLEAQAASALNHPNICTIYGVDEVDSRFFIAMELLQGQTLKQLILHAAGGKPLPVKTVLALAVQISGALDAAHSKGIVHRDIKPANIFVIKQGRVKVLDFGLAKLTRHRPNSAHTEIAEQAEPGMVMGTVGYMSPEQVRGLAIDSRTDIFAFGAVLYEMLAGRRAFNKPTSSETLAAILNEEPPAISEFSPKIPPALVRIMKRCLEKDPDQRFQSASDLSFALEALSESSGTSTTIGEQGFPSRRMWVWPAVGAGAVLAVAGLGVLWWRTPPAVPVVESVTQLTDDGEAKGYRGSTFTDGSRIYFNEHSAGNWKVVQVSVTGGPTASIDVSLHNPALVGLSPDGSTALAVTGKFEESVPPVGPLWSLPLPAGEPRRLGNIEAVGGVGYLPDGRLVFTNGSDLFAADGDGANPHKLASVTGNLSNTDGVSVSPDGQRVAFTNDLSYSGLSLNEVGTDGKRMRRLSFPACCSVWTRDGKYLLFNNPSDLRQDIWALPMGKTLFHRSSPPIRLTAGPLSYSGFSMSRDGKQVFAVGTTQRGELVRYDMKSRQFLPFLSGISAIFPTFSRDGQWVAYESYPDRSLWRSRSDGSEKVRLTYPPMLINVPHISPDGTKVAFTGLDNDDLIVVDTSGMLPPKTVVKHEGGDYWQAENWSPDSNLLLLNMKGELAIYDVRTGGVSIVPSSKGVTGYWIDQESILSLSADHAKFRIFDLRTQRWTDLATVESNGINEISPDGKYVYYETGGEETKGLAAAIC